jgi:hypothetical protein
MSAPYCANKKIGERVVTGEIRKQAKAKIIYDKAMGSLLRAASCTAGSGTSHTFTTSETAHNANTK